MAISAEQLNVILSARDREFTRAMDRAQRKVDRFSKQSNKSLLSAGNAFKTLSRQAAAFLPALSAGLVIQQVRRVVNELDNIGKTADKLGLTTDALQELRVAADLSGVPVQTLDMAMQRFGRRLAEARIGAGEAKGALEEMGIALVNADGTARSTEEVLNDVADAMQGMSVQTDRNRLAMKLFDSEGVALVNMLRNGAEGLNAMRQQARELGIVIDEDLIRNAEEAQDQLSLMSQVISANLTTALINLAPYLVSAAEGVASISTAVRGFFDSIGESRAAHDIENLGERIERLQGQIEAFESGATDSSQRIMVNYGSIDLAREALERLIAERDALTATPAGQGGASVEAIVSEADLSRLQAAVDAERERARLAGMTAQQRERDRIAAEADLLVQQALANIAGQPFTVEATAARIEAEALRDEYIAAATAASSILNPVKEVATATAGLIEPAETAAEAYENLLNEMIAASPALQALGFDADNLQSTMQMVESSMESAFMSMVDGTMSAKDAFRSMAADIIKELFRVLVVQRLVGGITTALGFPAAPSVGARAAGGPVQAGQAYMTGESGRELFVPKTDGRILSPAQTSSMGGGGGSVVVNQTINVSTGVQQTVRAEIKQLMPQIADSAKAAVVDAKRRGGSYGRAFS